jgi:HAD superfamily hydrolase (TIGR01484 family)
MKLIFSDFDGTLTHNGHLGAVFFDILNLIEANRAKLIIVSGRSLSWGHFFLSHFPIKAVIMEGGGVIVSKSDDGRIHEKLLVSQKTVDALEELTQKLIGEIPETIMSADSFGRKTDRAVEFKDMQAVDVKRVEAFLKREGANFSRSNVHINYWLGSISKSLGVTEYLKDEKTVTPDDMIFYGDAMNDESMFKDFKYSVGVSNISEIIDQLTHKPKLVLEGSENAGINGVLYHLKELFNGSTNL